MNLTTCNWTVSPVLVSSKRLQRWFLGRRLCRLRLLLRLFGCLLSLFGHPARALSVGSELLVDVVTKHVEWVRHELGTTGSQLAGRHFQVHSNVDGLLQKTFSFRALPTWIRLAVGSKIQSLVMSKSSCIRLSTLFALLHGFTKVLEIRAEVSVLVLLALGAHLVHFFWRFPGDQALLDVLDESRCRSSHAPFVLVHKVGAQSRSEDRANRAQLRLVPPCSGCQANK